MSQFKDARNSLFLMYFKGTYTIFLGSSGSAEFSCLEREGLKRLLSIDSKLS